ncbi:transmembrane and immunoglobulin domain-containing protein 1 [Phascolarctos cinereus]|uniref:transmembrane and immunoglobulin domain-containing protein 1 n=1 Tax=Phascolarctos cinereus TaxID=38626 RepID=UPI000A282683|nr:transmembrane and immunoglobulin domain-containing protein 1 [Phascolarctos cinereus]XP_020818977.1 transmembrane and immunoglobulin domain-containing protein 1 [Phascolarctos cinereus]XP_020818978.1 transmembrane and immunoglobulin domain-containing protein 1 [Phascolarctos cinereus]XP_020818979.1 transmembrane and immunoglobulin domain-containing protein 1 [Phascolarctos cinereus]XP_020818980.1 transmembrane and immunoglobulin domain-containing protein 1 [Phascolarctos cinereus]
MAWEENKVMQSYGSLLLVILLLPCGLMNVILTVNNNTQDFVLQTTPGTAESLKCTVQNHSQEEELLWYREDGTVDLKKENKINSSDICIYPVREDDNGITFTCTLQRNESVNISVILNVTYEPILSGRDLQTAKEGSNIKLKCNVKANPQAQMTWYKNDSVLTLEKDHHQIYQTSELFQLSISKVLKSDNGTYSCHANSPLKLETKDFHLIIEEKKNIVPTEAIIAAVVVVTCTILFGLIARREKIMKLCIKDKKAQSDTSL